MPHVALDTVRDGTVDPEAVRGAIQAVLADEALHVRLVGPADLLRRELARAGADVSAQVGIVDAAQAVSAEDDPVVAVRARRDASVRVAVEQCRSGEVDAVLSAAPVAATTAAARFSLPRMPGLRQPALAAVAHPPAGPVLVVDAGGAGDATATALVRFGELGAALAVRRGTAAPRVAVLAPLDAHAHGRAVTELDRLFRTAELADGVFLGAVPTGRALAGEVDVLVTPGATGRVLVEAVRATTAHASSHAVLVGVRATVATLEASDAAGAATALADVAALVATPATAA